MKTLKKALCSIPLFTLAASGCVADDADVAVDDRVTVGSAASKLIASEPDAQLVPNRYIVKFRDTIVPRTSHAADVRDVTVTLVTEHGVSENAIAYVYSSAISGFAATMSEKQALTLAEDPAVESIEQDQLMFASVTWGLDRTNQRNLPLDNVYTNKYSNGSGVHTYIIDTGIRLTHNEFIDRIGNGFDAVTWGGTANDGNGHGTHVAGTVGGTTYGMAPGVILHPVRVLNNSGVGTTAGVIAGVDWVTSNHIKPAVANMSLGGGVSFALDNAVANSISEGVTYVVSAGNDNANACNYSPARTPSALTVGATTNSDARSGFSNYGSCLDIFAPGSSITSAWHTSNTATNIINGTSMASPHVAGAAATYLSANPTATPANVEAALESNATSGKVTDPRSGSPNLLIYVGPAKTVYSNSFETWADFSNWLVWHNCASNGSWSVGLDYTGNDNPVPGGGSWALRMHTTGFMAGCSFPGAYALTPPIPAVPGKTYVVENWSRNGGNFGETIIIFYNSANQEIASGYQTWSSDAWQYNPDQSMSTIAPAGAMTLRIRYGLRTANEFADLELLRVIRNP